MQFMRFQTLYIQKKSFLTKKLEFVTYDLDRLISIVFACLTTIQEVPGSIPSRVRKFNSYLGSGMGSTQPCEDN